MEIDDDLRLKMQRLRTRESELQREKEELQHFARQELAQLDAKIDELTRQLEGLELEQDRLRNFLGIAASPNGERMAHGVLKELCFEALQNKPEGLRSNEVKAWIERSYPNIRTASVPATLSRQYEQGALKRDEFGRYALVV